jgi:hypothetical protein
MTKKPLFNRKHYVALAKVLHEHLAAQESSVERDRFGRVKFSDNDLIAKIIHMLEKDRPFGYAPKESGYPWRSDTYEKHPRYSPIGMGFQPARFKDALDPKGDLRSNGTLRALMEMDL